MRTNIEIDDQLIAKVLKTSGLRTKRAAVDAGLRLLLQLKAQTRILSLRGKVKWEGDLEQSRLGHIEE
jgi:Arc/MetJ family transcription regulator